MDQPSRASAFKPKIPHLRARFRTTADQPTPTLQEFDSHREHDPCETKSQVATCWR